MHPPTQTDKSTQKPSRASSVRLAESIATFLYVGKIPFAPGTMGSLAAFPTGLALIYLGGWPFLLCGIALAFGVGLWSSRVYIADKANKDPKEVVIDEVVGLWIAFVPATFFVLAPANIPRIDHAISTHNLSYYGLAFLLFRFFDIVKPWPIRLADRKIKGAFGIILDDILAGIAAGGLWYALLFAYANLFVFK